MSETLVRPSFQVERVQGKFTFPQTKVDKTYNIVHTAAGEERRVPKFTYEHTTREVDEAYMVYFPQGHSLCFAVDDQAALKLYGLDRAADNAAFGEVLSAQDAANLPKTPKQIVEARLARASVKLRSQGGLATIDAM